MEPKIVGKAFANFRGYKEQIDLISGDQLIAGRHKDVGYALNLQLLSSLTS